MSVNKVILIGNLGADPKIVTFADGGKVANLSLATNEKWKGKDGEMKERTEWHRLVAHGKTAELCQKYLAEGRQIYVEGKLQTRKYAKDGRDVYTTEVVIFLVQFLGGKPAASDQGPAPGEPDHTEHSGGDDDLPF